MLALRIRNQFAIQFSILLDSLRNGRSRRRPMLLSASVATSYCQLSGLTPMDQWTPLEKNGKRTCLASAKSAELATAKRSVMVWPEFGAAETV
jgi:hypothetical protein